MSPTSPFAETAPSVYASLCGSGDAFVQQLGRRAMHAWSGCAHGDLPRWRAALAALPAVPTGALLQGAAPQLGSMVQDAAKLTETLMAFHPWRKGPLLLGGVAIDAEWRSDWKWQRIAPHLELSGRGVLDIGCGNGYFGWRMLEHGAQWVIGIDPTLVFVMQWLACRHFAGALPNYVLPLGIEDLPPGPASFDCVFSMGVLYHRREPLEHLLRIRQLLRPEGTLVLETLVLPPARQLEVLQPRTRYARMRNVWMIPGTSRLTGWLKQAGYRNIRLLDMTATTCAEQRTTEWMKFESLQQALHASEPGLTQEGHPAPIRAVVLAAR